MIRDLRNVRIEAMLEEFSNRELLVRYISLDVYRRPKAVVCAEYWLLPGVYFVLQPVLLLGYCFVKLCCNCKYLPCWASAEVKVPLR